jgi:ABC-type multidrug transport system ATPase subunit
MTGINNHERWYPMRLAWKNITYSVNAKPSNDEIMIKNITDKTYEKMILHNESGYVSPGECLFIMGASGAGKTSLLNALCDRLDTRGKYKFSGEVNVNDWLKVKQSNFGNYGAYVMQDDILFPTFTAEQWLSFAATLRLSKSKDQIKAIVDDVIEDFGLANWRKTLVGNERIKGLSGGERKRTSIGVELITNPSILFLDEPTSGLDSFNAEKIVKLLVRQARTGKTIISTIHQPNSSTFKQFDRLLLMMEGHTIYQGGANESVDYFNDLGIRVLICFRIHLIKVYQPSWLLFERIQCSQEIWSHIRRESSKYNQRIWLKDSSKDRIWRWRDGQIRVDFILYFVSL